MAGGLRLRRTSCDLPYDRRRSISGPFDRQDGLLEEEEVGVVVQGVGHEAAASVTGGGEVAEHVGGAGDGLEGELERPDPSAALRAGLLGVAAGPFGYAQGRLEGVQVALGGARAGALTAPSTSSLLRRALLRRAGRQGRLWYVLRVPAQGGSAFDGETRSLAAEDATAGSRG